MNRRDFVRAGLTVPAVGVLAGCIVKPNEPTLEPGWAGTVQKVFELPPHEGSVAAMTVFQDRIYVATQLGTIYCITPE